MLDTLVIAETHSEFWVGPDLVRSSMRRPTCSIVPERSQVKLPPRSSRHLRPALGVATVSMQVFVRESNLGIPWNGPTTSGGAIQRQLLQPAPVPPGKFKPHR
jgi:hypothetical protein